MNAHDRRITRRLCARYGVTVKHHRGFFHPWTVSVNGEPVMCVATTYMRRQNRFATKAAAIRCGVAHAKRSA